MADLFMIRHGQSRHNRESRFAGWLDVSLSKECIAEATGAAIKLEEYKIDVAYTSVLKRAIDTLQIILDAGKQRCITVILHEALNERNYGNLQAVNNTGAAKINGHTYLLPERRSCHIVHGGRKRLKETTASVKTFFQSEIMQDVNHGLNVLIVAHGDTLRAVVRELESLNDEQVMSLEIATGKIYQYRFDPSLKIIGKTIL